MKNNKIKAINEEEKVERERIQATAYETRDRSIRLTILNAITAIVTIYFAVYLHLWSAIILVLGFFSTWVQLAAHYPDTYYAALEEHLKNDLTGEKTYKRIGIMWAFILLLFIAALIIEVFLRLSPR